MLFKLRSSSLERACAFTVMERKEIIYIPISSVQLNFYFGCDNWNCQESAETCRVVPHQWESHKLHTSGIYYTNRFACLYNIDPDGFLTLTGDINKTQLPEYIPSCHTRDCLKIDVATKTQPYGMKYVSVQ